MAAAIQEREAHQGNVVMEPNSSDGRGGRNEADLSEPPSDGESKRSDPSDKTGDGRAGDNDEDVDIEDINDDENNNKKIHEDEHEQRKLMRMSLNTALAIGLHNFPEGLATFVAALNDVNVGVVLAVAIAVHNIPEGLCVAMPIYYATGDRCKAFMWGILSGISEPIAALLGWAILASTFSDTTYAILFGVVAGMMVIISIKELLPTGHRYDPSDSVTTYGFIAGMAIMALSLMLFKL
jgi:ZIP family zinc transporter